MAFQKEKVRLDIKEGVRGLRGTEHGEKLSLRELARQDPAQLLSLTAPCVIYCLWEIIK